MGFLSRLELCLSNERRRKMLTGLIGQDNTSNECIVGDVPNIFVADLNDHDGPYNSVTMGCY